MTAPLSPEPEPGGLARHSERRSLILCAVGALAGLLVAGAGLFTAQGTRIAGVPAEDVAVVNGVPILMSDYAAQLQASESVGLDKATPAQKRKILDQMIREELYVQRGVELGLQNDIIEVRQALVGAVESQQAVDAAATQPTEAMLLDFYSRNAARYAAEGTITLTDYVADSVEKARAAVIAARGGQAVPAAMAANGLKPSGVMADGEEFYFAALIHLGPRMFAVAHNLRSGQLSDPIPTPNGVHVLAVQANMPPVNPPFYLVRDRVLADYRADKVARMQSGADRYLRKRADIQIAPGYE